MSNERLRRASGEVDYPSSDWLTELCYLLLRQGLPAGTLEEIVQEIEHGRFMRETNKGDAPSSYTNGWLARYARHLAGRLRGECDIEMLTDKKLTAVTQRRLREGAKALSSGPPSIEELGDAVAAMQSLDDLGSPEANQRAMEVLDELMRRYDARREHE